MVLANPTPEIMPEEVKAVRPDAIIATGRSDYPNQVNNVLCFPFLFRPALDAGATAINEEMKIACAMAIAELAQAEASDIVLTAYGAQNFAFGPEYIIPKPFEQYVICSKGYKGQYVLLQRSASAASASWSRSMRGGRRHRRARSTRMAAATHRARCRGMGENVADLGAGEILLTSMDADGTKHGYDLDLTRQVRDAVQIPVIASGGAGNLEHLYRGSHRRRGQRRPGRIHLSFSRTDDRSGQILSARTRSTVR